MVNNFDITAYLTRLGLSPRENELYLLLLNEGPLTALNLSRKSGINRSTLYRIIEDMNSRGFIEEVLDQHTTHFKATKPESLKKIIAQKQDELELLTENFPEMLSYVSNLNSKNSTATQVRFYRGVEGIKQLLWNTLHAKKDLVGFGFLDWNVVVGKQYAEKLRHEYVLRKIVSREIQNEGLNLVEEQYTDVSGYIGGIYSERCLPEKILKINYDTYIYDDIFSVVHHVNGDYFGVEIQNAIIAKSQVDIFNILWKMANSQIKEC